MIFSGNQPYFLPYLGYWQLINQADVFEIADNYRFIKQGWINRNRILERGKPSYFNIEVGHASSNKNINELYLSDALLVNEKRKQLMNAYRRAPYFDVGMDVFEQIFQCEDRNLSHFLENSIRIICNYLDIHTKLILASDYEGNELLKKEYRIYDMCSRLGTDTYCNSIGGRLLYSYEDFRSRGLKLCFLKVGDVKYRQFGDEFVPNLSILDVIMFNDRDAIKDMLKEYTIITEETDPTAFLLDKTKALLDIPDQIFNKK